MLTCSREKIGKRSVFFRWEGGSGVQAVYRKHTGVQIETEWVSFDCWRLQGKPWVSAPPRLPRVIPRQIRLTSASDVRCRGGLQVLQNHLATAQTKGFLDPSFVQLSTPGGRRESHYAIRDVGCRRRATQHAEVRLGRLFGAALRRPSLEQVFPPPSRSSFLSSVSLLLPLNMVDATPSRPLLIDMHTHV